MVYWNDDGDILGRAGARGARALPCSAAVGFPPCSLRRPGRSPRRRLLRLGEARLRARVLGSGGGDRVVAGRCGGRPAVPVPPPGGGPPPDPRAPFLQPFWPPPP